MTRRLVLTALLWPLFCATGAAQAPPQAATPATAAASAPDAPARPPAPLGAPLRITVPGVNLVARFPAENPFGSAPDIPAAPPFKPVIPKIVMTDEMYVAVRVDSKGKATGSRRVRDPIPSVAADTQKSLARWVFDPPKKGGQPVDTWTSLRLDLAMEIDPLRIEQISMTPVSRESPIPAPFEWPASAGWLDAQKPSPPTDGAVPLEQLDLPPAPRKMPWSADSLERPFTAKLLVLVNAAGKIDKIVPLQVPDPFLIAYLKKGLSLLVFKPARSGNTNIDTWNEITLSGTIDNSI
ncbi:MAG: hypothetical protein ACRD1B_03645, partial [Thermoanaerobaculia bacterium]